MRQWISDITCVANEAVAILEDYTTLDEEEDGFVGCLKACACICRKEAKLHNIGNEILSLKERFKDISWKKDPYGITVINNNAGEGSSSRPNNPSSMSTKTMRRTVSYAGEDQIFVGFEEVFKTLHGELVKEEPRRVVLSIYGMGGLGKTTLARNLYNSPNVVKTFSSRAWICVSQQYSISDLLQTIIKSIQGRGETLEMLKQKSERDLESHLRDLLKDRKYLVAVDDVWNREACCTAYVKSIANESSAFRILVYYIL